MNDAASFNLTFGVELEFLAVYNPEDYQDELLAAEGKFWPIEFSPSPNLPQKYGILIRLHMIQVLNENGFPTNGYKHTDFSKWTVDTDCTVTPVDTSENCYAIEVKTLVLVWLPAALEQVETAVKLLVSKFNLYINESCGLHVHVGNEDRGFTMCTLRNFCSLITVFEHQMEALHPADRLHNENVKPTRRAFNPEASPREKLSIINKLKTVEDVIVQFHCTDDGDDKYMAFNFFNLFNSCTNPLRTIEFRQHRGTLDPKLITNWVKVACNLVEMSNTNEAGFRDLIEEHMYDIKYTIIDLFKDLKLSELAEFYAPLVFQYGTDRNAAFIDEFIEDEEHSFVDLSSPGKYDTPWEKESAPRPPSELKP